MKRPLALVVICALVTGCASLHLSPEDSTGVKVTKGLLRIPVALLTVGLSEAWHARERAMQSWLGHHESELLMAWGGPSQVIPMGPQGKILVYTERRVYVSPGYATTTTTGSAQGYAYGSGSYAYGQAYGQAQSQTTYVPPTVQQWEVYRRFQVDPTGRIVSYAWKGL